METLEALSRRIRTTQDLQSIVRTMRTLSMVSIRQYEQAVAALRDYHRSVDLGLQAVLRQSEATVTAGGRPERATGVIVFGSDHGLCGKFNEQVAALAEAEVARLAAGGERIRWVVVGLRAAARLEAAGRNLEATFTLPGAPGNLTTALQRLFSKIQDWQEGRNGIRVVTFHNRAAAEEGILPVMTRILPLDRQWLQRLEHKPWPSRSLPMFTLPREALFSSLVREHLFVTILRTGAESLAAEHAARLAAMQAAERNIEEQLEEMHIQHRRVRQQSITEQLLDIIAGFETLESPGAEG